MELNSTVSSLYSSGAMPGVNIQSELFHGMRLPRIWLPHLVNSTISSSFSSRSHTLKSVKLPMAELLANCFFIAMSPF